MKNNFSFKGFREFYTHYLKEHSRKGTRIFHFCGTLLFLVMFMLNFYVQRYWFVLLTVISPYIIAWISHFFIEKNKPSVFDYFWWSLKAV